MVPGVMRGEPDVISLSDPPGEYDPNKNEKWKDPDGILLLMILTMLSRFLGLIRTVILIEEGVTSIAFLSAGYGNDNILVGYGRTFIRNIHTWELDSLCDCQVNI